MSRDIVLPGGEWWNVRTGVFYWITGTLAKTARNPGLADHLREFDQYNLPVPDMTALPADQRSELVDLIRALPPVVKDHLPEGADHEYVGLQIADLVGRLPQPASP